ncbi:MAG: glycosyltransferase family 1 protein [Candidatus Woesebacteria bacterium]|jgi:glycosyltransferase involved in cell wall biosynthesis
MKIVIDTRIINSSTGRYVERLVHYLEKIDQDNEYILLVPKKDLNYYKPTNPNFSIQEANFANYSLAEQFGLLKLLDQLKPDLVHFCMPQQPIFYRGKHVTTVHDLTLLNTYNSDKNWLVFKFKQLIGRFVFYLIGHTSAQIITPSQFTKDQYAKFANISFDKITVTYEASDVNTTTSEAYSPLLNKQFLLYVGQQSDYKNIRRLMQAHQQLRKKHPNLMLVFAGSLSGKNGAPLVANKDWAIKQRYGGILFTDFVSDAQLTWLYQHCATYVFPSLMEGFGLPGLEAMTAGAPVASSNATCLPEIYKDAAYYFDPHNVTDMAQKIDDILQNSSLRKKLINRGHKLAKTYSWQKMAKQTLNVYNNILTK